MLPLDKNSDGGRKCILDDARSSDRQLSKAEVFEGVVRATPAVRFPELEVDALYDKPVMVYWPMDRTTLSVLRTPSTRLVARSDRVDGVPTMRVRTQACSTRAWSSRRGKGLH